MIVFLSALTLQGAPGDFPEDAPEVNALVNHPPCAVVDDLQPVGDAHYDTLASAAREACRTGRRINAEEAEALLETRRFGFRADPDAGLITIAARPAGGAEGQAYGALNAPLDPIGDGLYASEFRLAALNAGMLTFYLAPELHSAADGSEEAFRMQHWRGPDAPVQRIVAPEPAGALSDHTLVSDALGETRRLVVYTPPGHDPGAGPYPVVYVADGGKVEYYGRQLDPLIAAGRLAPLILVGLRSGHDGIVDPPEGYSSGNLRNADYTPDFPHGPPRFDKHLSFVTDEVVPWAADTFGAARDPGRVVVNGRSGGGAFAYNAGLRRPDVFGHAFVDSPAMGAPAEIPDTGEARATFHFVAGRYETGFISRARRAHRALSAAGHTSTLTELSAGHTMQITQVTLADRLMDLFPGAAAD
ncbi:hypothetical protein AY599_24130 [Leptolyngbya valderiana BDU 20041]|nr:hypothetical protein AY599_24130 [Leptolyngbya valderiana BDU 20041]